METDSHSYQFKSKAATPRHSLALIFDIEGFSHFFSQPDVELYVPRFLNYVFRTVSLAINGGSAPWLEAPGSWPETRAPWPSSPTEWPALPAPVHSKYLGDGALYLWEIGKQANKLRETHILDLFYRISIIRKAFPTIMSQWMDEIPVANVPLNIRFGLAAGSVYRLSYAYHSRSEYMGYAINLASRLQKYCPEMGFISSARIEIPQESLEKIGYQKLVTRQLRGFPREVVIVRKSTYEQLTKERREELFIDLPSDQVPSVAEFTPIADRIKKSLDSEENLG